MKIKRIPTYNSGPYMCLPGSVTLAAAENNQQQGLSLVNLTCERDERVLFASLHADFFAGDIVQVTGANGRGKTTLLKIIIGTLPAARGEVSWRLNSASLRENLLYLGHHPAVNLSLTALENLSWYFGLNGRKSLIHDNLPDRDILTSALARVGLSGYEDVLCSQMSAGQHRRVALARLYISEAPLWLLDEPFTAIDRAGVAELEGVVAQHAARGGIVLLTTHQPLQAISHFRVLDLADFPPAPVEVA